MSAYLRVPQETLYRWRKVKYGPPAARVGRHLRYEPEAVQVLRQHIKDCDPVTLTLPWENPADDERVTVPLLFTTTRRGAINRRTFDNKSWRPAVVAAGITPTRATGMHALRHFYASSLLDAGASIKALASYLGHTDPGFTLRVYTHLMPASEERTRRAIDDLFGLPGEEADPATH
ncbi:tyrosine-type recombinase/integrase [Micromonospora sp. WMMD1274]|uniref:tyrosine-type recombinase/integrase n=1 Tax=Micromonospora sp. WMMD1274 TaxID=3404116 RepID=UPI003B923857